jgi:hypothetical protein
MNPPARNSDRPHQWQRRGVLQTLGATFAGSIVGLPEPIAAGSPPGDRPLIHLDPADLTAGPLTSWTNRGSLGGAFAADSKSPPTAAIIDGRMAASFDGRQWLRSSFPLPAIISGDRPFTVMMWIRAPRRNHHATLFTLGARPKTCAEFNNHNGSAISAAAFNGFGPATLGHRDGQPTPEAWHHLAYCYQGGENGTLRLYLNGLLSGERDLTVRTVPGDPCFLGSGFDMESGKPVMSYVGAIAGLIVLDRSLTWREMRNHIGLFDAFGATPADGATLLPGEVTLRWQSGRAGARQVLRITAGDGPPDASQEELTRQPRPGAAADEWEFGPIQLGIGSQLVWQVDQVHPAGRDEGPPWHIRGDSGPASSPVPRDRITGVEVMLAGLSWKPGPHATAQCLFFGEREQEVLDSDTPIARLDATATRFRLPAALKPGTRYFWRVASDNGNHPSDPGTLWTFRTADAQVKHDITFIIATDQHYGRDNNKEINHMVVGRINNIAGTPYPDSLGGGIVRTPLGVIAPGDLLDKGYDPKESAYKWDEWVADFGLTGREGHLVFPVYEGIGNHDGGPVRSIPRAKIRERNKIRPGLASVSPNGLHYSWDWEHVHFVQVNLFPGDTPADATVGPAEHDPELALEFLRGDLARHVGASGKPVVIIQHYGLLGGMSDWWTTESKERYYQAIENYNVIGIFCGHSHGNEILPWKKFLNIHCGSTARPEYGTGDFMVVHITRSEMRIAQRKSDSWGATKRVPIQTPA